MNQHTRIQKWGNSAAIRLPATILAAAGITVNSEVDIQAEEGRLVIQAPERSKEQLLDQLLEEIPDAGNIFADLQERLSQAIAITEATTTKAEKLCQQLQGDK